MTEQANIEQKLIEREILASLAKAPKAKNSVTVLDPKNAETRQLVGLVASVGGAKVEVRMLDPSEGGASDPPDIGMLVCMPSGRNNGLVYGSVVNMRGDRRGGSSRFMQIALLGEALGTVEKVKFVRGVSNFPPLEGKVFVAGEADLALVYAKPNKAAVRVGAMKLNAEIPAYVTTDDLLAKHFAILGTTGAGKSCTVTVLLKAVLDAHRFGHTILLDPHNEYGRAFGRVAERVDPSSFELPHWLLNLDELAEVMVSKDSESRRHAEIAILREALLVARRTSRDGDVPLEAITVDTPIPYRLSALSSAINEAMGALNKPENSAPYLHLIARLEQLQSDQRYRFMFSGVAVRDNVGTILSRLMRIPVGDKPITIFDISGVPSEIVDVVVSVLFRIIFELSVWAQRRRLPPVLLVCEEAHRYIPADENVGFLPTKLAIARIAREGRKYGVSLCLVSQRPSELAVSSLAQCNTIIALRMGNARDHEFVKAVLPDGADWLAAALPALGTQEAIIVGDAVNVPMHCRIDDLPPGHQPASASAPFAWAWDEDRFTKEELADAIRRWRTQTRTSDEIDTIAAVGQHITARDNPEPLSIRKRPQHSPVDDD
ncbi:MAG: ATP-binding protein [Geminicoccaceae bacterium]